MNKNALIFLMVLCLFLGSGLYSVDKKQMEKWVNIITEKDLNVKLQKLEEFKIQHGSEKNSQLVPLMYQHLCETSFLLKKYDKTIEYGEKALTFPDVEKDKQMLISHRMANAYFGVTPPDFAKAAEYSQKVIDIANSLKTQANLTGVQQLEKEFIAPELRLQGKIIYQKAKEDPNAHLEAIAKALEALRIDKSKESEDMVRLLASLVKKAGKDEEYAKIIEELNNIKPAADLTRALGIYYGQTKKDNDKALEFFLASYQLQKSAEVAQYLGILHNLKSGGLVGTEMDTAINYFAEAFLLNDPKVSPKADERLKHLYFNIKAKGIPPEEQEKGFQEILEAAKTRLGLKETTQISEPIK